MKRKVLVIFAVLILAFGVLAVLPSGVEDSSGVTNPTNILLDDPYYALGKFSSSLTCPSGFTVSGDYCEHTNSGQKISGWMIVRFDNVSYPTGDFYNLSLEIANRDDGCSGSGCGATVTTKIFTDTTAGWQYVGGITTSYGPPRQNELHVGNSTRDVIIARTANADSRPDVRWYWAKLENY